MLITRIELENIKSYRRFNVQLRRGTTAISGANGAGKTTLVEAIGYALFDSLPYNQAQFVREGEKFGRVVVHLIGSDERPYVVERRCGAGARWFIYDQEAGHQVDQRADVLDKLHDLFGIDRDRPLDSLFRDSLGVPQGTFTAIFLETAARRKQTFDTLLQIEDYKLAAEYLLEVQKTYKEQIQAQLTKIERLSYQTCDLELWQTQLGEERQRAMRYSEQHEQGTRQLLILKEQFITLSEQQNNVRDLEQGYKNQQQAYSHALTLLRDREASLQRARTAKQLVDASQPDYQRHEQASGIVKQLYKDATQRNKLRQRQASIQETAATLRANILNYQAQLREIAEARQRVFELAPLLEQQVQLEQQREELSRSVQRAQMLVQEQQRLQGQLTIYREKQSSAQRRIEEIEPLKAVAALFHERNEALMQLRLKKSECASKEEQLKERRARLQTKRAEREKCAERVRKDEQNIKQIEKHRSEAEEMPRLQEQLTYAFGEQQRIKGNIEAYTNSRAQSAGGQCPLLHETCLNMRQHGMTSLEAYFDALLKEERVLLAAVQQQHESTAQRIGQVRIYADALGKLDQYIDQRNLNAERLRGVVEEIEQLEQETARLVQELDGAELLGRQIERAEAAYQESKQASERVAELSGLYKQLQQVQEQIQQYEADLQARCQEYETLKDSATLLAQVERELSELHDPRTRSAAQQEIIAREGYYQRQLQSEQQQQQKIQQQLQQLEEQLNAYATLDAAIAQQEALLLQSEAGYHSYLQNVKEAGTLPEREADYRQQQAATQEEEQKLRSVEEAYQQARARFDAGKLAEVSEGMRQLESELSALQSRMEHQREAITKLERQIEEAEALRAQLEAAQQEQQTLEDLHAMTQHFRTLIKEAAPHVLKAMLNDISGEANRIFAEIMGDRSAQLSWQNDYEIMLRRQSVNRTFTQLSGGEQMSAALAVRLALLKKLSNLNIAFFDEPTQNMDELRRMNLAEQIRRVRGFEQLIVISHDDTFEQGLDSIIRLNKVQGVTQMVSDEESKESRMLVG
jgi:exonuclease SbcC